MEPGLLFRSQLDLAHGRGVFMTVLGHTLAHAVRESFANGHHAAELCAFVDGSDLTQPIVELWTRESLAARASTLFPDGAPGLRQWLTDARPASNPEGSLLVIVYTAGRVSSFVVPLDKGKANVS
jgi:hypothetical protein